MVDDRRFITFEEAVSLLNDGEYIHTFRNGGGMLVGADHDRKKLLKEMRQYESTLELAGGTARTMKHGLVYEDNLGFMFVATDEEKLNDFDPIK